MRALKQYYYNPEYAVNPGESVKETMEVMGYSAKDFASRLGITEQSLHRIFKGEQPISHETANKLELVTGTPARFWNNLEAQYQEQLAKLKEREGLASQLDWMKQIPVKEIIRRGVIRACKDAVEQLKAVLSFFGVSDVAAWERQWRSSEVVARRSPCFETNPGVAATWIRLGELQAGRISCPPYNKVKFREKLVAIRKLTVLTPEQFCPEMVRTCAEAGVALVFVPEIKGAPWSGATKWLSPTKPMILLSLRGKSEDMFWFSFFHEAGHILYEHSKKSILIRDKEDQADPKEAEANLFASRFLIPEKEEEKLHSALTRDEVWLLAKKLGISPGIVVGQYQHIHGNVWWFGKDMIRRFEWKMVPCDTN